MVKKTVIYTATIVALIGVGAWAKNDCLPIKHHVMPHTHVVKHLQLVTSHHTVFHHRNLDIQCLAPTKPNFVMTLLPIPVDDASPQILQLIDEDTPPIEQPPTKITYYTYNYVFWYDNWFWWFPIGGHPSRHPNKVHPTAVATPVVDVPFVRQPRPDTVAAPEFDVNSSGTSLTLLFGVIALICSRKRR